MGMRGLLFRLDAERAHRLALACGRLLPVNFRPPASLRREVMGLSFPSPLGLAAGMDKDATRLALWRRLGFGFVEVGTVTPLPQPGNPRPRLFRDPQSGLILNRMGFNSAGAEVVARRLERRPRDLVVGVNLGKNRETEAHAAWRDYAEGFARLAPHADYVVVNVSSPNTPGLRNLQGPTELAEILGAVGEERARLGLQHRPLLVKVSPDLADDDLDATVDAALAGDVDGIVATNTTIDRSLVPTASRAAVAEWGDGGISGRPLGERARHVRLRIMRRLGGRGVLIACGGIGSPDDVRQALDDGAALVQIYSALVFEGPLLVRRVNRACAKSAPTQQELRRGSAP
jgi:dihydroorotate dehydrogenase